MKNDPPVKHKTRRRAPAVTPRDRLLDDAADDLGAADDWNQTKDAACGASSKGGGACLAVNKLKGNWSGLKGEVSLHAVGHSAGSIFHAYFIQTLITEGFRVETLQLLAPAITIEDFSQLVQPKVGHGIGEVRMFALTENAERADHLLGIYQDGSLLYFILNALEASPNLGILGLKEYYDKITPSTLGDGKVVWAPHDGGPRTSSEAKTHTAFPTDGPTLHSLACNILNLDDPKPFHESGGWLGWLHRLV